MNMKNFRSILLSIFAGILLLAAGSAQAQVHDNANIFSQSAVDSANTTMTDIQQKCDKQFVVETHSDYIIDRVRMEIARGTIPAEDVGILYLEKCDFETRVHSLELSQTGDILNAPPSYRAFFLQEELNLLYRAGR